MCEPVAYSDEEELVYWYQDCWGDCSYPYPPVGSCEMGEPVYSYAYVVTLCDCVDARPLHEPGGSP